MRTFTKTFLEDELSKRLKKKVELSKDGVYASDIMAFYREIIVDNKKSGIRIDIDDLTEWDARGKLREQLDKLANKLKGE